MPKMPESLDVQLETSDRLYLCLLKHGDLAGAAGFQSIAA